MRALTAAKLQKMFGKPFVCALEGHTDSVKAIARSWTQPVRHVLQREREATRDIRRISESWGVAIRAVDAVFEFLQRRSLCVVSGLSEVPRQNSKGPRRLCTR